MTSENEATFTTHIFDLDVLVSVFVGAKAGNERDQYYIRACEEFVETLEENHPQCVACNEAFDDKLQPEQFQISEKVTDEERLSLVSAACGRCAERGPDFIMRKLTAALGHPGVPFSREKN